MKACPTCGGTGTVSTFRCPLCGGRHAESAQCCPSCRLRFRLSPGPSRSAVGSISIRPRELETLFLLADEFDVETRKAHLQNPDDPETPEHWSARSFMEWVKPSIDGIPRRIDDDYDGIKNGRPSWPPDVSTGRTSVVAARPDAEPFSVTEDPW